MNGASVSTAHFQKHLHIQKCVWSSRGLMSIYLEFSERTGVKILEF